ncbi:putative odorant receptor 71a [Topomyia yanbarensis]|uniref:putative odorant receptor 71a n=1 Tax=Topomyia yanbarensis TaxID=2498891 RepID=UPI00273C6E28|nr:putative odorant receptor 71a [Topomyia yanbarensis]
MISFKTLYQPSTRSVEASKSSRMLFERKKPFPMMTLNIKLCKLMGLWNETNLPKPCWQAVFYVASMICLYILPGLIFIIRQEHNIHILRAVLECIAMTVYTLRFIKQAFHREELQSCYNEMQEVLTDISENRDSAIQTLLKHLQRSAQVLVKYYLISIMSQSLLYGLIPALASFNADELPPTVLEQDFLLFDHRSNVWIWLAVLILCLILQYVMLLCLTIHDTFFWNTLHHISCLFKLVKMEIAQLDDCKDAEDFKEKLATIVHHHEVCYRAARVVERALHPVLAMLYCFCIFGMCNIMFIIYTVDDYLLIAMESFVLNYTTFLIFSFSMLGTELMESSLSVSEAIYNTQWYTRSVNEQRLLLFMQMRSQRVVAISAGKFFNITRATFAGAMQSAFSYFTIIQRFYG